MHPILFYIGKTPIFSYGIFVVLGTVVLFATTFTLALRNNRKWGELWPVAIGVFVGGIVGARISHMFVEPSRIDQFSNLYALLIPGTPGNIAGLLIGGYLGGLVILHRFNLPSSASCYAVGLAAASVVWRIGCSMAGCCHGTETALPWAMTIDGVSRHPTMIYEGVFNLAMLGILIWLFPKNQKGNALLMLYLACYFTFRFWLEFIRLYPPLVFGLTGIQIICLLTIIGAGIWYWRWKIQANPTTYFESRRELK